MPQWMLPRRSPVQEGGHDNGTLRRSMKLELPLLERAISGVLTNGRMARQADGPQTHVSRAGIIQADMSRRITTSDHMIRPYMVLLSSHLVEEEHTPARQSWRGEPGWVCCQRQIHSSHQAAP